MSTIDRSSWLSPRARTRTAPARRPHRDLPAGTTARHRVRVTWLVSRAALANTGRLDLDPARGDVALTLMIEAPHTGETSVCVTADAPGRTLRVPIDVHPGELRLDRANGLVTVDAKDALSAVFDSSTGRLRYAYSPVLSQLGLRGGRYEVLDGALESVDQPR